MSRRTLIVPILFIALLGAGLLLRSLPREDSRPPARPPDKSGIEIPDPADGTGDAVAGEGEVPTEGVPRIVRGRVVTGEKGETPVPGARVLVFEAEHFGDSDCWLPSENAPDPVSPVAEGDAGQDGKFEVRLPPGVSDDLRMIARAEGYREGSGCEYELGDEVSICMEAEVLRAWRVEDSAERPVAGALVLVYGDTADGLPVERLVTDDRGRFETRATSWENLLIRKAGFAIAHCDPSDPEPRVVVLRPAFRLAGVVSDEQAGPVERAEVHLYTPWWRTRVVTAADGRFAFDGLGDLVDPQLKVIAPGFLPLEWEDYPPGREDLAIVLHRPEGPDATGSLPIREVLLHAVRTERTRFEVVRLPDRTDVYYELDESRTEEEGVNVLTGLPPGEYEILSEYGVKERIPLQTFEKVIPRFRATARVRVEAGEESPLVTLRLEDIGHSYACIRVLDAAEEPAKGVRLHCETPGLGRFTKNHHWYTSPSGRIVTAVEEHPGSRVTYTAYPYARHAGIPTTSEVTTVATPAGPFTDLKLESGALLSIRVLGPDAEPLPKETGLRIEVEQAGFPEWMHGSRQIYSGPGRAGPIETNLLSDRPFALRVQTFRHATRSVSFPAPGPGRHEISVRVADGAGVSGKLLTPGGSSPGTVDIRVLDKGGVDVADIPMSCSDGTFWATGLPPGRLTLVVESYERGLSVVRKVEVSSGESVDLGEVILRPMARLRGTVLGADQRPAAGVEVSLREADENVNQGRTVTRMDGRFEMLRRWCARPLLVARLQDGSAMAHVLITEEGGAERLTLRLQASSEVFARFELPVGIRISGPMLSVEMAGGIRCFPRSRWDLTADHRLEGYRILQVPPGALVIRFEGRLVNGDPVTAEARVTVKPGETTETLFR